MTEVILYQCFLSLLYSSPTAEYLSACHSVKLVHVLLRPVHVLFFAVVHFAIAMLDPVAVFAFDKTISFVAWS